MDDLLIECPIHLDTVSIKDVLVFKCGHGFCAPCLNAHFSSHPRTTGTTCPTCRKPVKRKDAFPLFLAPARPLTQARVTSSPPPTPQVDIDLTLSDAEDAASTTFASLKAKTRSLAREVHSLTTRLRTAQNRAQSAETSRLQLQAEHDACRKAHADTGQVLLALQEEHAKLKQAEMRSQAEVRRLQDQCEMLEKRRMKEAESSAHAWEENEKVNEEVKKMRAECQKAVKAKTQAEKDAQHWKENANYFEKCVQQYRDQLALQKRKTKTLRDENARLRPLTKAEDDSLVVVHPNDSDHLQDAEPDLAWLDDACAVQGDRLDVNDEDGLGTEATDSEDELLLGPAQRQAERGQRVAEDGVGDRERPLPHDRERPADTLARFPSDWSLRQDLLTGPSSGTLKKRKHGENRPGGTKIFKVDTGSGKTRIGPLLERKIPTHKSVLPLNIDQQGHIVGTVAVGSRRKLNSKN